MDTHVYRYHTQTHIHTQTSLPAGTHYRYSHPSTHVYMDMWTHTGTPYGLTDPHWWTYNQGCQTTGLARQNYREDTLLPHLLGPWGHTFLESSWRLPPPSFESVIIVYERNYVDPLFGED